MVVVVVVVVVSVVQLVKKGGSGGERALKMATSRMIEDWSLVEIDQEANQTKKRLINRDISPRNRSTSPGSRIQIQKSKTFENLTMVSNLAGMVPDWVFHRSPKLHHDPVIVHEGRNLNNLVIREHVRDRVKIPIVNIRPPHLVHPV